MGDIFSWLKAAAVGLMCAFAAYHIGEGIGHSRGLKEAEARAAKATIEQLKERGLIDETVSDLDDCALLADLGVSDCGGE